MRYLLGLWWLMAASAWSMDLWLPDRDLPSLLAQERNARLAREVSALFTFPVSDQRYDAHGLQSVLDGSGLALVDPQNYEALLAHGWVAVARFPRTPGVQLVTQQGEDPEQALVVGTPGQQRVEHWLAPALAPQARELVTFNNAQDCLRRLFSGIDGCLVKVVEAEAYAEQFDVALNIAPARAFRLPGAVLFQKPPVWDPQAFVGLELDGSALVAWHSFDEVYYRRMVAALQRMKDESDSQTLLGESSYTPVIQGESDDAIRTD